MAVEFESREDVERWLTEQLEAGRPKELAVAMAARSALRALPGLGMTVNHRPSLVLKVLRGVLAETVASWSAEENVREVLRSAYNDITTFRIAEVGEPLAVSSYSSCVSGLSAALGATRMDGPNIRSLGAAVGSASAYPELNQFAAVSSDASFMSTAFDDACEVFFNRLWPIDGLPEALLGSWQILSEFFRADPSVWDFWHRWYRAHLEDGSPLDWKLQEAVALIPDEDWEAGPERVAARIAEIEADFRDEPLDQDALRSHSEQLVQQPDVFADAAESTGNQITEEIARYKAEAPANVLPDGFAAFELLPDVYGQIATVLRLHDPGAAQVEKLQAEINRLHGIIAELRRDLEDARFRLETAERMNALEAAQMRTWGEKLQTTLTNVTLVGALGMSMLTFFGMKAEDLRYEGLKEQLQGLSQEMREYECPMPRALPDTTEV